MKKLLMTSAAVCGLVAFSAADAQAQIEVSIGGHTKNYIGWLDQDETSDNSATAGARESIETRSFDMQRESELHFNAVGVADNGLEYGFQVEMNVDGGDSAAGTVTEESYLFLSGDWGRVNLGSEDGANYLLQVAAPSADSNIDGIRQYINPVNYPGIVDPSYTSTVDVLTAGAAGAATGLGTLPQPFTSGADAVADSGQLATAYTGILTGYGLSGVDYDNDITGYSEKLTYLSPIMNGFQAGVSYTPDVRDAGSATGLAGFNTDDVFDVFGEAYEGAIRYEGTFNNVGVAVGAGYTHVELEDEDGSVANPFGTTYNGGLDDFKEWNVGLDLDIGAFGIGAIYTEHNNAMDGTNDENETYVVGIDYTTGPFKLGASYLNNDNNILGTGAEIETDRYTGGVIYTAAEGLTFRGSVSHIEHELDGPVGDADATSVMGGIQFNF